MPGAKNKTAAPAKATLRASTWVYGCAGRLVCGHAGAFVGVPARGDVGALAHGRIRLVGAWVCRCVGARSYRRIGTWRVDVGALVLTEEGTVLEGRQRGSR
jgi:hypothetical protein